MSIQTTGPDRTHFHAMWGSVAGGWAEHSDYVDARGVDVTEAMLDLTVDAIEQLGFPVPADPSRSPAHRSAP